MKRKLVSAMTLALLLTSMLTLAFHVQPVEAEGTVYIRADGSIDPPTAPISTVDNVIYTLTDNMTSNWDGLVIERDNMVLNGAGYAIQGAGWGYGVFLTWERSNVTVKNVKIQAFEMAICLESRNCTITNNIVTNNTQDGIYVDGGDTNVVSNNQVSSNLNGISVVYSTDSIVLNNNVSGNNQCGIYLFADRDVLSYNIVSSNGRYGIYMVGNEHRVFGNTVSNNSEAGILLSSSNNIISGNSISLSQYGVEFDPWSGPVYNNTIFKNNFVDNAAQVYVRSPSYDNRWDNGYPSGGNFWSDYNGTDIYCGAYQNETGSDGIGDTPYVIDSSNHDNYPFMKPFPYENGTIYIRADGSIDPSGAPIQRKGETYTLTGNIIGGADGISVERSNIVIDGAGYTIQGSMYPQSRGINCKESNVTVSNVTVTGFQYDIALGGSFHNITSNIIGFIYIAGSSHNVAKNIIARVYIEGSFHNVSDNRIAAGPARTGIWMSSASNNSVLFNNVSHCELAICMWFNCRGNIFAGNNIADNHDGIAFQTGNSDNKIIHNNFFRNVRDAVPYGGTNVWDDGYPYGGNCWSNYTGADIYHGSSQNEVGSDGIGDTPRLIDASNVDHYPLMDSIRLLVGDVNGDGYVGIDDLYTIAMHFAAEIGQPKYLRTCDINFDGYIGIDDLYTAASHFGEETP
jgi:parallel beta-helix repeat protein